MLKFLPSPALLATLLLAAPGAVAQDDTPVLPDGFSILAPQAEPGESEAMVIEGIAGAFLDRDGYLARRANHTNTVLRTRWQVEEFALDGSLLNAEQREIIIGDSYVFEPTSDERTLYDFGEDRILTRSRTLDGPVMRNASITAHVHRQMDTFTYFTRGGELQEIAGPGGNLFERFWIESAMGVRLSPVEMVLTANETSGQSELRRDPDGSVIFGFAIAAAGDAAQQDLFRRWLRHALPVHPDALLTAGEDFAIPESFNYIVFSPTSPDGRREVWTRLSSGEDERAFPWPDGLPPAPASAYGLTEPDVIQLIETGMAAARLPGATPPRESFINASRLSEQRADRAGAYLELRQATHHIGACARGDSNPVCQRLSQVTAGGLGDPTFERMMGAISQSGSPEEAFDALQPHLSRGGYDGAAANLMAAQNLASLQAGGDQTDRPYTPISLFATSAALDPYAPLTYWHAGRLVASYGDVEAAWMLFDVARSLDAAASGIAEREAGTMSDQLRELAPDYFGPTAQTRP